MSEVEARGTGSTCVFCGRPVVKDGTEYREVKSWVHGPKLDGPVLREQTGRYAHEDCVKLIEQGQAPDQEALL